MLAFLIALISLKILELRSARDFTVVALLSYFMVLSAFFYNQSLALSLYLVVAIAANTVALDPLPQRRKARDLAGGAAGGWDWPCNRCR